MKRNTIESSNPNTVFSRPHKDGRMGKKCYRSIHVEKDLSYYEFIHTFLENWICDTDIPRLDLYVSYYNGDIKFAQEFRSIEEYEKLAAMSANTRKTEMHLDNRCLQVFHKDTEVFEHKVKNYF